jgi:AcrR family transcriptional regulator
VNDKATKNPHRAPDPRPARTRAAILDAVERLGASGSELSVSGIVSEAGLSRSSFYSQFKDLGDISVQLVREIFDRVVEACAVNARNPRQQWQDTTTLVLVEFSKRRGLYAATLGSNLTTTNAQWEVADIMTEGALLVLKDAVPAHIDPKIAARFIASGYLCNIAQWLTDEHPRTIEELADQLREMLPDWVADKP